MKKIVIFLALGLFAPLAYAYGYGSQAPSGSYYHSRKSYASFAAWCVDFACTKDENYTYYNSISFYNDREKCDCQCPTPTHNSEKYYQIMMDYRLVLSDAALLHNDSVSDLNHYCPHMIFKGHQFQVKAWDESLTVTPFYKHFDWNPHVPCHWMTSTGKKGTSILTWAIVDTLKQFSVLIICIPDNHTKLWVVHSSTQQRLEPGTEKYILRLLQKMNMDTSQIFRPDFSQCGVSDSNPPQTNK